MPDIKPCPFNCDGGVWVKVGSGSIDFVAYVVCPKCGCRGPQTDKSPTYKDAKQLAIELWNKRA